MTKIMIDRDLLEQIGELMRTLLYTLPAPPEGGEV